MVAASPRGTDRPKESPSDLLSATYRLSRRAHGSAKNSAIQRSAAHHRHHSLNATTLALQRPVTVPPIVPATVPMSIVMKLRIRNHEHKEGSTR
jgi:hypothetical protein